MASKLNPGEVDIRGKVYLTVALRVANFRSDHPDWTISTEIHMVDADVVIMKATISNESGRAIGTGYAEEHRASSQINKTSALENCETSAIGRALAACGYGGTEYASANEVQNVIHQQKDTSVTGMVLDGVDVDPKLLDEPEMAMRGALHKLSKDDIDLAEAQMLIGDAVHDLDGDHKVALWKRFSSQERAALKKIGGV